MMKNGGEGGPWVKYAVLVLRGRAKSKALSERRLRGWPHRKTRKCRLQKRAGEKKKQGQRKRSTGQKCLKYFEKTTNQKGDMDE